MNVWCVHGIRSKPTTWLGKLRDGLNADGFTAELFFYGFVYAVSAWFVSRYAARDLAKKVQAGDWIICHSNGFRVVWLARVFFGMPWVNVIAISGALDSDIEWPVGADNIFILATPNDKVLKWAARIPWSKWGKIGRNGYTGNDKRFVTITAPAITGHNDWDEHLDELGDLCGTIIRDPEGNRDRNEWVPQVDVG